MRLHAMVIALAALFIAAADTTKNDVDQFQGSWKTESLEFDGQKAPREAFKDDLMIFDEKEYTQEKGDEVIERGKYKLDPSKKPKEIDFDITEGPDQGKHQVGIYELSGNTLKVSVAPPGVEERPTDFTTKPGAMTAVVILKREKPKGVPTSR
jgi:uncharacterized protein (TIGR03067 family)